LTTIIYVTILLNLTEQQYLVYVHQQMTMLTFSLIYLVTLSIAVLASFLPFAVVVYLDISLCLLRAKKRGPLPDALTILSFSKLLAGLLGQHFDSIDDAEKCASYSRTTKVPFFIHQ
jgi:hypothetical protein